MQDACKKCIASAVKELTAGLQALHTLDYLEFSGRLPLEPGTIWLQYAAVVLLQEGRL